MKHKKQLYREPREKRRVVSIRLEDSIKALIRKEYGKVQKFIDYCINEKFFSKKDLAKDKNK